ncbi:MAG: hypothetical protein EXR72_04745 [Myxococcales bacterium]|nr:hypothetical protein [Myxococcales bacterium]
MRLKVSGLAVFAFFAFLAIGCGPSFRSVQATAALGQKLADHTGALDEATVLCAKVERLTGGGGVPCARPDPRWHRGARVLIAYSGALTALAGQDDLAVADHITGVLDAGAGGGIPGASLTDAERGIIALAADAIVAVASQSYREIKIEAAIRDSDGYVQGTVKLLASAVDSQDDILKTLRSAIRGLHQSLEVNLGDPGRRSERVILGAYLDEVNAWSKVQRRRLAHYKRALLAFGAAHRALAEHAHDFSENDLAIYQKILGSTGEIMKTVPDDEKGGDGG